MTPPYRLHYAPDNASLIVRLVLDEMGLPYETALVNRAVSAQRQASYLALNPAGKIPTLETPGGVISETGAILLYLAETHGQMAPPVAQAQRPAFLKWLFFTANTLHSDLAMHFYMHRYGPPEALPDMRRLSAERVATHLSLLENAARPGSNGFDADSPTVLDYYIATCLRWCALYPKGHTGWFNLRRFPALHAMAKRLEPRPAVQKAIQAEGLGPAPFTAPTYANPPEGVAL